MSDIDYRCVCCGCARLEKLRTSYRCTRCNVRFPVLFNVPLFFKRIRYGASGYHMHRATAERIARLTGIEVDRVTHYVLHQIYSYDYFLPNCELRARDNRLLTFDENGVDQDLLLKCVSLTFDTADGVTYGVDADVHTLQVLQLALSERTDTTQLVAADSDELPISDRVKRSSMCHKTEAA